MAEIKAHEVQLSGYRAITNEKPSMCLGTYGSYGVEKINVTLDELWSDLIIDATFTYGTNQKTVIVPYGGGSVEVPPEATRYPKTPPDYGRITFRGIKDGLVIYSADLTYTVSNRTKIDDPYEGESQSSWEQFVNQVLDNALVAMDSADKAEASAQRAETALSNVENAKGEALSVIDKEKELVVTEINTAGDARYAPIASAIKVNGKGDYIVGMSPTVPWYVPKLRLFGRTTQDGVPSPDNPVELVSPGSANGRIIARLFGKNLIPLSYWAGNTNTISDKVITETGLTFSIAKETSVAGVFANAQFVPPYKVQFTAEIKVGSTAFTDLKISVMGSGEKIVLSSQFRENEFVKVHFDDMLPTSNMVTIYFNGLPIGTAVEIQNLMITADSEPEDFQPYQSQEVTISTPNGLPGIPVESGGNYTDETGQQWICDEMDFEKGTYTQRCSIVELLSSMTWKESSDGNWFCITLSSLVKSTSSPIMSNYFSKGTWAVGKASTICLGNGSTSVVGISTENFESIDALKVWLDEKKQADNPCYIVGPLITPVVSEIPAETLTAYKNLQTYYDITNVLAANCGIEVTALADSDAYLKTITDRIAALEETVIGG